MRGGGWRPEELTQHDNKQVHISLLELLLAALTGPAAASSQYLFLLSSSKQVLLLPPVPGCIGDNFPRGGSLGSS